MIQVRPWAIFTATALALGCGGEPGAMSSSATGADVARAVNASPPAHSPAARIPLVPGLTIVTAIVMGGQGDGESVKQIVAADDESVTLTYSADVAVEDMAALLGGAGEGEVRQVRGRRRVLRADLASAREYMHLFGDAIPESIPGSTALGVSAAVLAELKDAGESALTMRTGAIGASIGNLIAGFAGPEFAGVSEIGDIGQIDKIHGTLRRIGTGAVPVRVLVNGTLMELPAVHARGWIGDREGEFHFLDDPANPLTLGFVLGDDRLQVVKIAYAEEDARDAKHGRIGMELAERGRAELHGIYFDFDSDELRPESRPVLEEIAATLVEHGDWSLSIEGHTDNSGSEAHNLELSRRRAAAVRKALTSEFGIADARLESVGLGAARPKGTNDTVAGRALNRRVELVRR